MIARGARASRKRFAGILDQFNHLSAIVSPGRELWSVFEVAPVRLRLSLRRDLNAMNRAQQIIEWCRVLSSEHDVSPKLYLFLNHALNLLDSGHLARAAGVYPRLLAEAGIMPHVGGCVRCNRCVTADFQGSLVMGVGLVCRDCSGHSGMISVAALRVVSGERCEEPMVANEVEAVLTGWLEGELGKALKVLSL